MQLVFLVLAALGSVYALDYVLGDDVCPRALMRGRLGGVALAVGLIGLGVLAVQAL